MIQKILEFHCIVLYIGQMQDFPHLIIMIENSTELHNGYHILDKDEVDNPLGKDNSVI